MGARKKNFGADTGYKQIYESIGGKAFEGSGEKTSVVVKEMSHWIGVNDEYKKLVTLTSHPVATLIRNPLLTVESRIRRVVKTLDMRPSLNLQQHLLDKVASDNNFESRANFLDASETNIQTILKDVLSDNVEITRLYNNPVLSVQNDLLNYCARTNGYINWRDLIDRKLFQERDYKFFESILKVNTARGHFEENEFKKLDEITQYFKSSGQQYIVFDTTDIRAEPTKQLQELCSRLGVTFSPEMLKWGEKPVDFHTQQHREYEKIWYDKLFSSSEVDPPVEIPPTLSMFPGFAQQYLRDADLPIYATLSKEKIISEDLRKEINDRKFNVDVTEANRGLLRSLGVIQDEDAGTSVPIELGAIDPIYALTNEPSLAENAEFRSKKQKYADEMAIVSEALNRRDERNQEWRSHIKFR